MANIVPDFVKYFKQWKDEKLEKEIITFEHNGNTCLIDNRTNNFLYNEFSKNELGKLDAWLNVQEVDEDADEWVTDNGLECSALVDAWLDDKNRIAVDWYTLEYTLYENESIRYNIYSNWAYIPLEEWNGKAPKEVAKLIQDVYDCNEYENSDIVNSLTGEIGIRREYDYYTSEDKDGKAIEFIPAIMADFGGEN